MKVTVNLPDALFAQADGRVRFEIETEGDTVASILDAIRREMPGVHQRLLTEQGQVRPHINIFVGDESIRWSGGLATPVTEGAEVHVIPAVSGGTPAASPRSAGHSP